MKIQYHLINSLDELSYILYEKKEAWRKINHKWYVLSAVEVYNKSFKEVCDMIEKEKLYFKEN